ncbi:Macrophage erythroblast attacher isoform 1 [Mycena venus]|uniref:Macrophage erythroblast attacher isoform 1 n=1 Tax=Mycena venus TaxID=2733690 RepID=A0A8H6XL79_9AGAR|nr:Macrophage erythroblast attacher isoform 1 [Mycena venus]
MSYHAAAPPSPTSSASSFSSGPPPTPTSPDPRPLSDYQTSLVIPTLPDYSDAFSQKPKQNTAERRASHNAVERARRETLNARFLDLAALLPNLKHLRRPSKSAIVNSSIAHVRAARRYRQLASQQLRALNAECDMVRREVNQWRARAGVHPAVAPPRSEGFALVLGGEEPAFDPVDLEGDDDEDADYRGMLPHRRPQPTEAACEGPLLLSHPYARTSPPPTYDASGPAPTHAPTYSPSTQGYHPSPPHSASPVAASFEAPNPYDGFLLQQQQGDEWAYAAAAQGQPAW